jgi:hypothetical protein
MPMHHKNSCKHRGDTSAEQPWFTANVDRQRRRREMAKVSKRKNRRKK